jgi:hypothetical protein
VELRPSFSRFKAFPGILDDAAACLAAWNGVGRWLRRYEFRGLLRADERSRVHADDGESARSRRRFLGHRQRRGDGLCEQVIGKFLAAAPG